MAPRRILNLSHLDAAENVFFARELEHILAEQFDEKKVGLKARQLVPVDNSVEPTAESVTYKSFKMFGEAKLMVDMSDDLPMANVSGVEITSPLRSYGEAYGYSIDEIKAGQRMQRPLDRMRADAARKALDIKLDKIAAIGDDSAGLKGLLNLDDTDTYATPDGAGGDKAWAEKTPTEILADMNAMISQVVTNTKEVERPTRLIVPTSNFELIQNTARSDVSDTTILKFFQGTHPGVEVLSWERLSTAGENGVSRMVAYDPKPLNLRLLMAIELEQLAPELENFAYTVNMRFKTGGVIAPYPKSIIYGDEI